MNSNNLAILIIFILLLIIGVQFLRGKWLFLIAGYNILTSEEKNKINGKFIGKIIGGLIIVSAFLVATTAIYPKFSLISLGLEIISIIITIIYTNQNKDRNHEK